MSNFQTFGAITEGLEGSAPARFIASTTDSLAAMLVAGYLNDKAKIVKANDVIDVNYLDASNFPLNVGESSLFLSFYVQYDPTLGNWNMIPKVVPLLNIAAYGVTSDTYSYAGGSTAVTVIDSSINPNSVVIARWQSSANASIIKSVLPGNGLFTVVTSVDPGASVLEYISVLPSLPLQNAGVIASTSNYAGGSATFTIVNPLITSTMIPFVNFSSQTNGALIETVIASTGLLTIVANTDPGVSVIEYIAVLPSVPLKVLGFYADGHTNAGGSATTTVSDSNITASSIIVANWRSQVNAVEIEKVTPTAGTLTILSSGDPGASILNYGGTLSPEGNEAGIYLVSSNNLSDVGSPSTSLANLGGAPLSGGQLTGSLLTQKGTGTIATGAVTINTQSGVITGTFSTSAASTTSVTFNNSKIVSTSVILVSLMGGTNVIPGVQLSCAYASAGVGTLVVTNNNVAGSALSGTLIIGFVVL